MVQLTAATISPPERERLMESFRLSHHHTIQQTAKHSEYEWLDTKTGDVLVVSCPHRLTNKELGLQEDFCGVPVLVWFAPHLSFLNPDRHTEIMRRLYIDNEASLVEVTESQVESPGRLLRDFISTYGAELQSLSGHTTILVAKLRDEARKDSTQDAIVIITSDWSSAIGVEIALHGKYFQGHKVLVLRDEWDDCSSAGPVQDNKGDFDNAWQDPPLLPEIMLGAWMGDMTASALFDIEITENGMKRRICPAMIQASHGFVTTDSERENIQLLVGKKVLDPGASLVKKTIRYLKSRTDPQPDNRESILNSTLETGVRELTGSDDILLLNDPLRYTNHESKPLSPLSIGKISVVMQDSDACFIEIDPSPDLGRGLARPANTLAPEGINSRRFIRNLITEQPEILKEPKLTGTFSGGTETLIAAHKARNVLFYGARSGLKEVRLFECAVLVKNKDSRADEKWTMEHLVGMNTAGRASGIPPALGGDSSAPVFNSDGVFLGVVKGSWRGVGVSFMVPFEAIQREAGRRGISLTLL